MALYGWTLDWGVCIARDESRGKQLVQQSKIPMAHALRLVFVLDGSGGAPDQAACFKVLTTECDASDPHVQWMLGVCYDCGLTFKEDEPQAVQCYERAGNHIVALNNRALLVSRAGGCAFDPQRSIELLTQSARQGYSLAQQRLAGCYERGFPGVSGKDIALAKYWYSLAAEQGSEMAAYSLKQMDS
eukprot:TRINITY_DN4337_c0_g1_i2.p1 TRINITY_DN4337_c0_g1~~TRINITY_DN4337_c0_g1_i2.p1  ORF type:complete len:199 (+),score=41.53 TRINITY_DN4337_c0_g1_i2:37-597(+)